VTRSDVGVRCGGRNAESSTWRIQERKWRVPNGSCPSLRWPVAWPGRHVNSDFPRRPPRTPRRRTHTHTPTPPRRGTRIAAAGAATATDASVRRAPTRWYPPTSRARARARVGVGVWPERGGEGTRPPPHPRPRPRPPRRLPRPHLARTCPMGRLSYRRAMGSSLTSPRS